MTFYEMLEQVIALLQRHGRLSYRALKVQFELDDDRLDLLKEELIDIQHIARDQDGRMLVWTGEAARHLSPPRVTLHQQDSQATQDQHTRRSNLHQLTSSSRSGTTATHRDVL